MSYPGDGGKYKSTNLYLPFHELPDEECVATDEQMQIMSPEGQGWWPVIALQTVHMSADLKRILLVCFYQLLDEGRTICWWIYVRV